MTRPLLSDPLIIMHTSSRLCQHKRLLLPSRLIIPSLYAANSRIASLNRSMKAALITPFVSSLALTWKRGGDVENNRFFFLKVSHRRTSWKAAERRGTHIEIQQHVHLILDDGDGLEELLRVHGSHHSVRPAARKEKRLLYSSFIFIIRGGHWINIKTHS